MGATKNRVYLDSIPGSYDRETTRLPILQYLAPIAAGTGGITIDAHEAEGPEDHAHHPMAEIRLQELIWAAAGDDCDAVFAAHLDRVR